MRYFNESLQISAIFQVASSIKIILDIENKFVLFTKKMNCLKAISRESDVGKAVLQETAQFLAPWNI